MSPKTVTPVSDTSIPQSAFDSVAAADSVTWLVYDLRKSSGTDIMALARKVWQTAKGKVRTPRNWESTLRLKDNFGPHLDDLDKLASDVESDLKSVQAEMAKLLPLIQRLQNTMQDYSDKIWGTQLIHSSKDVLSAGLNEAWGQLKDDYSRLVRDSLHELRIESDRVISELD